MKNEFSFDYPKKGYLNIPNFKKLETIYPNWKCDTSDILYSIVSKLDKTSVYRNINASIHHSLYRSEVEVGSYVYKLYSLVVKESVDGMRGEVMRFGEVFIGINDIKDLNIFVRMVEDVENNLINAH